MNKQPIWVLATYKLKCLDNEDDGYLDSDKFMEILERAQKEDRISQRMVNVLWKDLSTLVLRTHFFVNVSETLNAGGRIDEFETTYI